MESTVGNPVFCFARTIAVEPSVFQSVDERSHIAVSKLKVFLQVVPILRAGLALQEQAMTMIPAAETYHVGCARDDRTLQVCNLPQN